MYKYLIFFIVSIIIALSIDPLEDKLINYINKLEKRIKKKLKRISRRKGYFGRRAAQIRYNSSSLIDIKKTNKYKKFVKKRKKDPNKLIAKLDWIWFSTYLLSFIMYMLIDLFF